MKNFTEGLKANFQHYIPIIDGAIPVPNDNGSDIYNPYTVGTDMDIFIKNANGSQYLGSVWPGITVFVDQSADSAQNWWNEVYANFTQIVDFSGIWFDMIGQSLK